MPMNNLRDVRTKRGLTQEELEALSGIEQATISKLETQATYSPAWETVWLLAKGLKVRPEVLFPIADRVSTEKAGSR